MAFTTLIDTETLARHLTDPAFGILDCRFKIEDVTWGEREYSTRHIPGAANHFFKWNVNDTGTFRSPEDLRERLQKTLGDVPPHRVVCYCGSGVTACHNLLALEHAGLSGAKLYPGSWSEWSSHPSRPTEP